MMVSWRSVGIALVAALSATLPACAGSRGDAPELAPPVSSPTVAPRTVRTHESRPPEETAESTQACLGGTLTGCHAAALDAYYAKASPDTDARALALFQKACDQGYAPSCNGLGVLYAEGRGVGKDPVRAASLYRRSCEADASTGCQHLAFALRDGRGVAKDPQAAERADARSKCLFQAALEKGPRTCPTLDGERR